MKFGRRHVGGTALAVALLLVVPAAWAGTPGEAHLLAGASAFREGRFPTALVEFRVARELGVRGESAWYVAATLLELKEREAALEAFAQAEAEAPGAHDALLDYYRAVACADAHLVLCADALLAGVSGRVGPKLEAEVRSLRASIAQALATEPPSAAIDELLRLARAAQEKGRVALARLYAGEGAGLSRRRLDRYRAGEADALLTAAVPRTLGGSDK